MAIEPEQRTPARVATGASRARDRREASALVVIAALTLTGHAASAAPCPGPDGAPALAAVDSEKRLSFLAVAFDREVREVDLWSRTWGSIYVGAAVAQTVAIPIVHDHGVRTDLAVGAVSAAIGAISLFGLPLQITLPLRGARRGWSDADRCRVLAHAEDALARAETQQHLATGWIPHAGNVAFNAGLAVVLGWGFGRWKSAAISAAVGTAVGEANVFTQPHHLRRVRDRYRAAELDDGAPPVAWTFVPLVAPDGAGAALRVTF